MDLELPWHVHNNCQWNVLIEGECSLLSEGIQTIQCIEALVTDAWYLRHNAIQLQTSENGDLALNTFTILHGWSIEVHNKLYTLVVVVGNIIIIIGI